MIEKLFIIYLLITQLFDKSLCKTHWKVTESGRIEINDDSEFTLLRPYDLHAFVKQSERSQRLKELRDVLALKKPTKKSESSLKKGILFNFLKITN